MQNDGNHTDTIFDNYNSSDLLAVMAGISLMPENHGKNFSLEQLTIQILKNFNTNAHKATQAELENLINENASAYDDDEPVNLFTDLVSFYSGDAIVFPGSTIGIATQVGQLLKTIFQWPHTVLTDRYKATIAQATEFVLALSKHIAHKLYYTRYMKGTAETDGLVIPDAARLARLKEAVTIPLADMYHLMNAHGISKNVLNAFLLDRNDPELDNDFRQDSPIITRPIMVAEQGFVIISPTSLIYALAEFIRAQANESGCVKALSDGFSGFTWHNLQLTLKVIGFRYLEENHTQLKIKEADQIGLYRIDDDKIAFVHLDHKGQPRDAAKTPAALLPQIQALPRFSQDKVLNIAMISSLGEEYFFMGEELAGTLSLCMEADELRVFSKIKNTDALDLYKFAHAFEKLPLELSMMASFLDRFAVYRKNQDSFYISNDSDFNVPVILPGNGTDFHFTAKQRDDVHSALYPAPGGYYSIEVVRKDKLAPVYMNPEDLSHGKLRILVAGFRQAIWVEPVSIPDAGPNLRHLIFEIGDAIAYWLWQISSEIADQMPKLGGEPLKLQYQFDDPQKFEVIERNFERVPDLLSYFKTSVSPGILTITVPQQLLAYLYGNENEGERTLVNAMLQGFNQLLTAKGIPAFDAAQIAGIIEKCAPLGQKKKVFILDTSENLLLDPSNLPKSRYIEDHEIGKVLDAIVPGLGNPAPVQYSTKKEKNDLAFAIVQKSLLPMLRTELAKYNSTELIKKLIRLNEALIRQREHLRIHTPTRIACFVSPEKQQHDLLEELEDMNRTSIAVRCLLEHIAAEPYQGTEALSTMAIDQLIAIMDQIITWGSVSDQIHFDLLDMDLGILESGRIGSDKTPIRQVFDPFRTSKAAENVHDAIGAFKNSFPQLQTPSAGKPVPPALDRAFERDHGISFIRICAFIDGLVAIAYPQPDACASFDLSLLNAEINKHVPPFEEPEFKAAIAYLSLSNRGNLETLPKSAEFIDIMPWRFNRILSLLRKPLIMVEDGGTQTVYWGFRHILQSRITLMDQCLSGRFRGPKGSEVTKVLGKFANERGEALIDEVLQNLNTQDLIHDRDVFISPNGKLKHTEDIGDVDILLVDPVAKILYSLECKAMSPSRNVKEMIEEVSKLFGGGSEKGWVEKHLERHAWLEQHLDEVSAVYNTDLSGFQVKSFFVTEEEMLTPHLRKQTLPLPFVSAYDFKRDRNAVLTADYSHQLNPKS